MLLVWKSSLSDEKQKRQTGKVPMRLRFIRFAALHAFFKRVYCIGLMAMQCLTVPDELSTSLLSPAAMRQHKSVPFG